MKGICCLVMLGVCVLVGMLTCMGCESEGLTRDVMGQDYAKSIAAMDEGGLKQTATSPQLIVRPIKLAVAQLGEVSPPAGVIERLRQESSSFASVQSIPCTTKDGDEPGSRLMRRHARDLQADYLFVYGGTVDHAVNMTPLAVANLTIVGAFVVPGEKVQAWAKASGSLIEVSSGRVLLTVNADAEKSGMTPTAARDGEDLKITRSVQDQAIARLTDQFAMQMKTQR